MSLDAIESGDYYAFGVTWCKVKATKINDTIDLVVDPGCKTNKKFTLEAMFKEYFPDFNLNKLTKGKLLTCLYTLAIYLFS